MLVRGFVCGLAVTLGAACSGEPASPSTRPAAPSGAARGEAVALSSAPTATASDDETPPPVAPGAEGPLYLAVRGVGVMRLEGDAFVPIFPTKEQVVDLAVGPGGSVFASYYEVGTVMIRDGKVTPISKKGVYSHFGFRSDDDVFGTPDAFEWSVDHFDGKKWTTLRRRGDFAGTFSDNKLNDLAVTSDSAWASSWNGLFRGEGGVWVKVVPSVDTQSDKPPYRLLVHEDRLIGQFDTGWFERTPTGWVKLAWPADQSMSAISKSGIAAGITRDDRQIVSWQIGSPAKLTKSEPIRAGRNQDLDVDDGGRVWVAGTFALSILDARGKIVAEYEPGTLDGVTGTIERVAVARGGPSRLPRKSSAPTWEIHGNVEIYKSSKPLASATVELCASALGCKGAPWSTSATTGADGSFVLRGVPPGDLDLDVAVPPGLDDCKTPFTESPGRLVSIARDCASAKSHVCDIGTVRVCLPFEMPPPH
ncbi:MAG TPA: carboxypeptidase-like regulatory domain-containing protein [Polyangiaceae bacterium]|nr:carboxypeptidase-like regulatory domain-containing protein [Polyangiaceae bacterium]